MKGSTSAGSVGSISGLWQGKKVNLRGECRVNLQQSKGSVSEVSVGSFSSWKGKRISFCGECGVHLGLGEMRGSASEVSLGSISGRLHL